MYKDYLDAIKRYHKQLKQYNRLPQRLLNPTPRKIRDECVTVFHSRFRHSDTGILNTFFEVAGEVDPRCIKNFDLDKFKPLVNYLREDTDTPADKNIELLAWLLDFPQRPYDDRFDYRIEKTLSTEAGLKNGDDVFITTANNADKSGSEQVNTLQGAESSRNDDKLKSKYKKTRRLVAALIVFLGIGAALYFSDGRGRAFGVMDPGQKGCMVWMDDHYEQVSCDSPGRAAGLVLGLDQRSLDNLRRVTRPDTITEKHIGKLWYNKRGGDSLEYFTAGGRDPSDPNRNLKPLSKYIFKKYLRKKDQ